MQENGLLIPENSSRGGAAEFQEKGSVCQRKQAQAGRGQTEDHKKTKKRYELNGKLFPSSLSKGKTVGEKSNNKIGCIFASRGTLRERTFATITGGNS